jgi:CBS domain containing-hemolysin-like protein
VLTLVAFVAFALSISFLCSLCEATLFSVRYVALTGLVSQGSRGAKHLYDLKQTRIDDAISAVLILNTLANTLGATMAGAQAASIFGSNWIGLFSGLLTLSILVVAEIIPKTLGAVYSSRLAPTIGWLLFGLTRLMAPALVVSRTLTRLMTPGHSSGLSRAELTAIIGAALKDGTLARDEATIFENLLRFNEMLVGDVMTPRTVAYMLPASATIDELLADRESEAFSRIPLYHGDRENVVGYLLQRDVLHEVAKSGDRRRTLDSFRRQIWFVPEVITVSQALQQFLRRREPLAMVTDEHGGIAGLVTLEDLTETLLGAEIVDESDRITDLQKAAVELRDRRLERLTRKRAEVLAMSAERSKS